MRKRHLGVAKIIWSLLSILSWIVVLIRIEVAHSFIDCCCLTQPPFYVRFSGLLWTERNHLARPTSLPEAKKVMYRPAAKLGLRLGGISIVAPLLSALAFSSTSEMVFSSAKDARAFVAESVSAKSDARKRHT